jgi:hypothetical protein
VVQAFIRGQQLPAGRHRVCFEGIELSQFDDGSPAWRWVFVCVANPELAHRPECEHR